MIEGIVEQAERIARRVRRCFVCHGSSADIARLFNPRNGRRVSVCGDCLEGRLWSLKAEASPDDPMLLYLEKFAPLYTLFPAHVARCLLGRHRHPRRNPHPCLEDWRVTIDTHHRRREWPKEAR